MPESSRKASRQTLVAMALAQSTSDLFNHVLLTPGCASARTGFIVAVTWIPTAEVRKHIWRIGSAWSA